MKALALKGMNRNTGALALEPENAHYWHVKGVLLTDSGNCNGAQKSLGKSLELDSNYNLPYPGLTSARENFAALNTTCIPAATQAHAFPSPTKPSLGGIAFVSCIVAFLVMGTRKQS